MIICKNCGTQNAPGAGFCTNCGAPLEKSGEVYSSAPPQTGGYQTPPAGGGGASGKSIAALVLGILSIVGSCGPVTGIVAIILANQELRDIRNGVSSESGKTLAQVGLWTGWIGTIACGLFWLGYLAIIIIAVAAGGRY